MVTISRESKKKQALELVIIPTARSIKAGTLFVRKTGDTSMVFMKLKPTGFILNSNIIADVLNRGDCLVCNMEKGTMFVMEGDTYITPLPQAILGILGE